MAIKDCIDEIRRIVGDKLSAKEVERIAKVVSKRAKQKAAENKLLSEREALEQAAEEYAGQEELAAKIARRNRALKIAADKARADKYRAAGNRGLNEYQQMLTETVGTNRYAPGARASTAADQAGDEAFYLGGFMHDLQKDGTLEFLTQRNGLFGGGDGVLDKDVADALFSIGKDGKVATGGDPHVKALTETIWKWQEAVRLRKNRAGAWIKQLPGYIVQQSHDPVAMLKAGFAKWAADIKPALKPETYGDSEPDDFLESVYEALTTGVHMTPEGEASAFSRSTMAARLSQERVLQFKDGAAWSAYNAQYGARSLIDAVTTGLRRGAHDIALLEHWGPDPDTAFKEDRQVLIRQARVKGDRRAIEELSGRKGHFLESLDNQWAQLTGRVNVPVNATAASLEQGFRNIQTIGKLPLALFSHLTLPVTAASELRWQGLPLGSRYTAYFGHFFDGLSRDERREAAFTLGVGWEGWVRGIGARFGGSDAPGITSSLARLSLKLNGMTWAISNSQRAFAEAMAAWVGKNAEQGWSDVSPQLRQALERYGFDEDRWEVLREAAAKTDAAPDGVRYLTADSVARLPDSSFSRLGAKTARAAQRERDRMTTMLSTYYMDRTNTGIPNPGARERAILNQGTQPGTLPGIVARAIGQFKQFPLTMLTRVVGRDLDGYGYRGLFNGKGDVVGLAAMVAQMWVAGALGMMAKQVAAGKWPIDPVENPLDFAQASLGQSAGLGLYSDFLFHEYDRFGQSPLTAVAGPEASTVSDAVSLLTGLYQTKRYADGSIRPKTTVSDAIRFGSSNVPVLNLPYTRMAFDYLVLWHLQEWASPGYLRRSEKNLKRNTGQTYIVPPSSVVPYGGGYQ